jgi:hypothetical protein
MVGHDIRVDQSKRIGLIYISIRAFNTRSVSRESTHTRSNQQHLWSVWFEK